MVDLNDASPQRPLAMTFLGAAIITFVYGAIGRGLRVHFGVGHEPSGRTAEAPDQ